jgi:hypothetical protein
VVEFELVKGTQKGDCLQGESSAQFLHVAVEKNVDYFLEMAENFQAFPLVNSY